MFEGVELGAGLAWRLLATLEGGTLLLATSALIAYTTRRKLVTRKRNYKPIRNVMITNTSSTLGRQLQAGLIERGCSVTSQSCVQSGRNIDCLVVIGAECNDGLDGISQLVTEDVYSNLKSLECLSRHVVVGGTIVWSWCDQSGGSYSGAAAAFRAVLRASLIHISKLSRCEAVWVDGQGTTDQTVDKILEELFPCSTHDGSSLRNATHIISKFLYGWLKVT